MISHELGICGDVSRREVIEFQSLSLDPTKGLQVLQQEIIFRQLVRQLDAVVVATLRHPCNSLDLLNLLVIRR